MGKRLIGLAIAAVFMILIMVIPAPEGLSQEGWYLMGILLASLSMWISDCWPKTATTMFIIAATVLLGVYPSIAAATSHFMDPLVLMVFGSMFLAAMFDGTNISMRLVSFATRFTKDNGKAFLLVVMIAVAVAASVLADFASAMIFLAFVAAAFHIEAGIVTEDNLALKKALMIAIPTSSLCGSLMIPIGGPINLVVMGFLKDMAGVNMTFITWAALMIPVSFGCLFILWAWICIMIKPGKIGQEQYEYFQQQRTELGPWSIREKKAVIVLFAMLGLWVIGSWVPLLASAFVILLGVMAMYFPGMDLIDEEDFKKEASWDLICFLGGLMILSSAIPSTGLIDWAVMTFFSGISNLNPFLLVFVACIGVAFLRFAVPAGPPVTAMAVPALITIGLAAGINPVIMAACGTTFGAMVFVLPVDGLKALTYQMGQYSIPELIKVDIPAVITMAVFVSLYVPFAVGLLGL